MSGKPNLDNYVSVEERITAFHSAHPEGAIQTEITHLTDALVVVKATVFKTPDHPRPTTAHSQINIPGKTPFTRDSEIENAETSAVGRALAFMGFDVRRGIASREEVRNKHNEERDPEGEALDVKWNVFLAQCKEFGISTRLICSELGFEPTSAEEAATWMKEKGPKALDEWEKAQADPARNWSNLVSRLADRKAAAT